MKAMTRRRHSASEATCAKKGTTSREPRVAIIGAGMAGIAAAARLSKFGHAFDVFEQSPALGGTWYDAQYPGAAVDTPQPMYSFSFTRRQSFSRTYTTQPELLAYLNSTVDSLGIREHFHFGVQVLEAAWSDETAGYTLSLSNGDQARYDVVVTAVGSLNNPRYPDWPHLNDFGGTAFHSARWRKVNLTGKRVAVVGTGSASAQITAAIAPRVAELLVFQRQPGWLLPKPDRVYSESERALLARPLRRACLRGKQFVASEIAAASGGRGVTQKPGSRANRRDQAQCEKYIAEVFANRPDLRALVTPSYPFGGKRIIRDSNYYPALLGDNVRLIPRAVVDAYEDGLIDADGERHAVDVIVMATGYQASNYLGTVRVIGRGGRELAQVWDGEPSAFMGLTVPGFPNFYIMFGPNTFSTHLTHLFEHQAAYVERCVRRIRGRGRVVIEVKPRWHRAYNRIIQRLLSRTVTANAVRSGVHNYYAAPSGRIVATLPISNGLYALLLRVLGRMSTTAVPAPSEAYCRYVADSDDVMRRVTSSNDNHSEDVSQSNERASNSNAIDDPRLAL